MLMGSVTTDEAKTGDVLSIIEFQIYIISVK